MIALEQVSCGGGIRCLCDEHTAARLAKATVTPITDALPPAEVSGYLSLAVDAYALQNDTLRSENTRLREERVLLNGEVTSARRRVEQVLLHRWRSRAWTAASGAAVLGILDGTVGRLLFDAWQAL